MKKLFGIYFVIIVVVIFIAYSAIEIRKTNDWKEIVAIVDAKYTTKSFLGNLRWRTSQTNPNYIPVVEYHFELEGKTYNGNRFELGNFFGTRETYMDELKEFNEIEKGDSIKILYNPKNPSESVVHKPTAEEYFFIYQVLIVGLLALGYFWYQLKHKKSTIRKKLTDY